MIDVSAYVTRQTGPITQREVEALQKLQDLAGSDRRWIATAEIFDAGVGKNISATGIILCGLARRRPALVEVERKHLAGSTRMVTYYRPTI